MASIDPTRAFVKDIKRIIIKVGASVASRIDGRLALDRLGSICLQVKEVHSRGLEVILVSSGAVEFGRQRLKCIRMVNSRFSSEAQFNAELDAKACATIGQHGLMALYDTLFDQLDLISSELLVTEKDFSDQEFKKHLTDTVDQLLGSDIIPIFYENAAVSTRKDPYVDSSGIFWDNDGIAALLAGHLKADLLVLLNDVEGLYSGPPGEPHSMVIHTYLKEAHHGKTTFGDESRIGRVGIVEQENSAIHASSLGTPVIITSGFATDSIIKVLQGEKVGTLFHKDATLWTLHKEVGVREMAVTTHECSRQLQDCEGEWASGGRR